MKIKHLKVNHLTNPLGYDLANPTISYVVTEAAGKRQAAAQVDRKSTRLNSSHS